MSDAQHPDLLNHARDHIKSLVADLEGEDDFMPFMLVNSPKAHIYVALDMPGWGSPRDDIADVMMAIVAMHRADEAVFASCAWMLTSLSEEERKAWGNRSFEEHPDRKETVFMVYVGPQGEQFHSAPVTRENNKVTLGDWFGHDYDDNDHPIGGRFGNAMQAGMAMARGMPPEMVEYMEAAMARGEEREAVIEPMIRAYRRIRSGDFTDEEMAEAQKLVEAMKRKPPDEGLK